MLKLKRIYDPAAPEDGYRVLVDRLWPRGLAKEKAGLDAWLPEIAPSRELRRWFGHAPEKWQEFVSRYSAELDGRQELVDELLARGSRGTVTLLYAARDQLRNNAVALLAYLERRAGWQRVP